MKICLIETNRTETFKEVDELKEDENPAIMGLKDCFALDAEGNKVPIFIPRMGEEATKELCRYVFQKYNKMD